jgi:hypothetical protein
MKRILILSAIIFVTTILSADINYFGQSLVSELWFGENGHFYIEVSLKDYHTNHTIELHDVFISNGQLEQRIPYYHTVHVNDDPMVLDLTSLMPSVVFNPEGDTLIVRKLSGGELSDLNEVSWGSDFSNDCNPPFVGQSLVNYVYHLSGTFWLSYWCKDAPPTPGTSPYCPVSLATLEVMVTDENHNPLPGVVINRAHIEDSYLYPICTTDSTGMASVNMIATDYRFVVEHPLTYMIVYNQSFWMEPNDTTHIDVIINMTTHSEDEHYQVMVKGLKAYPVPFNASRSGFITFAYDGEQRLVKDSSIRLYDSKGRFVKELPFPAKGTTTWTPPRDIASGMYIAKLIMDNKFIDTKAFSIIK